MGGISTSDAVVSGLPFYVWEVPGKPISIRLPFDVIDRMSPDILRGFSALKRRGAEVGGILLGRSEDGPQRKIVIEDFIPVPTEYLTGPSYTLSDNDRVAFEAALAQPSGSMSGIAPVGFYRSHTRGELFMDDADLDLACRYFPAPENIFLLVKPFATRPSVGGFFFWEDGEIYRETSYLQFPFDRRELGGGDTLRPAQPPRAQSDPVSFRPHDPVVEQALVSLAPADHLLQAARRQTLPIPDGAGAPHPSRSSWRWLVPVCLAAAAVAGFFAYRNLDSSKAADDRAVLEASLPLRLSVAEDQNQLDVTWDRNASAIMRAKRGVLTISDGSNRRDLELSGAQLRNGRVLYSKLSADVNFRLEVFAEGQAGVSESIRIVSSEPPKPPEPKPDPPIAQHVKPAAKAAKIVSQPRAAESAPEPPVPGPPAEPAEVELQRPSARR